MLHAQETIPKQVTLGLQPSQTFREVFTELNINLAFGNEVSAQTLAREAVRELLLRFAVVAIAKLRLSCAQRFELALSQGLG